MSPRLKLFYQGILKVYRGPGFTIDFWRICATSPIYAGGLLITKRPGVFLLFVLGIVHFWREHVEKNDFDFRWTPQGGGSSLNETFGPSERAKC